MRYMSAILGTLFILVSCQPVERQFDYPESKIVDQRDLIHGVEVTDPYRWLENLDSEATRKWVKAQNKVTFSYLESLPHRDELRSRLEDLWNYEKFGVPKRTEDRYFFTKNSGLQNQSVVYYVESLDGELVELLDPNTLSDEGIVALTSYNVSPDGTLMAYGTASAGSDWQEWKIRDVETGKDLEDHLQWIKFSSVSWTADSAGFFYSRYDEPSEADALAGVNYNQKVYYHQVGTEQSADSLVYHRPDQKEWLFGATVSDTGDYLILDVRAGSSSENAIFYEDLRDGETKFVELLSQFDARYNFLGNQGSRLWFKTDLGAPLSRIIEIDVENPVRDEWRTLVPETEDTLENVALLNNQFVCLYLSDASSRVRIFSTEGEEIRSIELPGLGTASGFTGDPDHQETFFSFTNYTTPATIYRLDLTSGETEIFREPEVAFDPDDFVTEQIFYSSKDGTRVPMFLSYKKGLEKNGENLAILYGYGGFNISITPAFSVTNLIWMEQGGIYCVANLRGGGEYGEEWHQAGMKLNKQNVFDDFISAAEWLIANNYTTRERLAIEGASNGGLLVGAAMTQRPELFGATIPRVGVMDMLRFHEFTIGWAWVSDYGSPNNPEEFEALHSYSPYHNIQQGIEYPPTLVMTADHDDRVVPAHSFKFTAALQKAQAAPEPVLIRIETKAGHGAGKPTSKRIEESVDKLAFLLSELGD